MMTMNWVLETLDVAASAVLPLLTEVTLKGTVLLLLAGGGTLLLRRASAATRYVVWAAALGGLVVLPAVAPLVPSWQVGPASLTAPPLVTPASTPWSGRPAAAERPTRTGEPLGTEGPPGRTERASSVRRGEVVTMPSTLPPKTGSVEAGSGAPGLAAGGSARERSALSPEAWIAGIWMAGASALGFVLVAGLARLMLLAGRARRLTAGTIVDEVARLSAHLGLDRRVLVLSGPEAHMPMTWGAWRPVLLLPRTAATWPRDRLRHVLLHELAHVKRLDHPVQIAADLIRAIHWFNPLVWVAVSRLRIERERACDDRVLDAGCRASAYAEDLLDVARSLKRPRPLAAAVPMARRSGLPGRLRAILDPATPRHRVGSLTVIGIGCALLLFAVPLASLAPRTAEATPATPPPEVEREIATPAFAEGPEIATPFFAQGEVANLGAMSPAPTPQEVEHCVFRRGGSHSTSVNSDERRWDVKWSTDNCSVEIEVRGEVAFTEDERGIARISRGGRFEIEEEIGRSSRRLRVEAGSGGSLEMEYWVDGDRRDFDAEGREWLASFLPQLFRHTTIHSERRALRILAQSGTAGLLREIEQIESDHVAARYFEHLLTLAEVTPEEVIQVLELVARRLDSDHYRASILLAVAEGQGLEPGYRAAYLTAARGLDSDHYRHQVLEHLLRLSDLEPETLVDVLETASDVESDHYLASILIQVASAGPLPEGGRDAYLRALSSVDSDHYAAEVLGAFLDRGPVSDAELAEVLAMAQRIESDHYQAMVLQRVAREHTMDARATETYLRVARRIDSDHYLAETLGVILDRGAGRADLDLVFQLVESIESDHYRAMTLTAVLDRIDLEQSELVRLIEVAGDVASDHQSGTVLEEVARRYSLEGAAREAYLNAADGIGSRHYRDRALAALARGR